MSISPLYQTESQILGKWPHLTDAKNTVLYAVRPNEATMSISCTHCMPTTSPNFFLNDSRRVRQPALI